jgi:hypothetical protein
MTAKHKATPDRVRSQRPISRNGETARPGAPLERRVPVPRPGEGKVELVEEVTADLKNDPRHDDE